MAQIIGGTDLTLGTLAHTPSLCLFFPLLHLSDCEEKIIFVLHRGNWMQWKCNTAVKKESTNNPPQHDVQM